MAHGHEMPPRTKPADDNGYLEMLTKAVFQSGFNWQVIRQKWSDFQRAFEGFNVQRVAAYGKGDLERLLVDPGTVRNRRKVTATIENARTMVDLADEHGSFHGYLRTLDSLSYAQKRKRLVDQFHSLEPTGLFVLTVDGRRVGTGLGGAEQLRKTPGLGRARGLLCCGADAGYEDVPALPA